MRAWDPATGRLIWVDILSARVHTYDPVSGEVAPGGADDVCADSGDAHGSCPSMRSIFRHSFEILA